MESSSSVENNADFVISGYEDANSYSQDALRSVLTAIRASNDLPVAGNEFDYYSTFQGFRAVMLREGQSILSLMTSLVQSQGIKGKFEGRGLDEKFDLLVDVNDAILENVGNQLDDAVGIEKTEEELSIVTKRVNAINTSWNKKFNLNISSPYSHAYLSAKNMPRPQLSFKDKIDNTNSIFVPILKEKPHSIKPLAIIIEREGEKEEYCHPYEWEIERFCPTDEQLQEVEPTIPKPLEETPLIFVKSEAELKIMCDELKKEKVFAVDLEHHSYRSYQGFTCLMQISTREKDYIVDVLLLRSEMQILNEAFTDPKIVKVFHGADMDVLWLQRDFGIYVVNMFDTGQAARLLHFAHLSLAFLLRHYCKLDVDKKYQLADWRIRPLPAEMVKYAREDTHHLLYVYDCLKRDLLQNGNELKNLLHSVFERSKLICLKKYEKPLFSEDKYLDLYKKNRKCLNPRQMYCLKELYAWRDQTARENDESLGYILPNHMLLQIAEALPREQQGILACCNPIPPFVRQQLNELHNIIYKACEMPLKQLEASEFQQEKEARHISDYFDFNNVLHCPHDIHHLEEQRIQIEHNLTPRKHSLLKKSPSLAALVNIPLFKEKIAEPETPFNKVTGIIKELISPFQRYKITKQFHTNQQNAASKPTPKVKRSQQDTTHIKETPKKTSVDAGLISRVQQNIGRQAEIIPQKHRNKVMKSARKAAEASGSIESTNHGDESIIEVENPDVSVSIIDSSIQIETPVKADVSVCIVDSSIEIETPDKADVSVSIVDSSIEVINEFRPLKQKNKSGKKRKSKDANTEALSKQQKTQPNAPETPESQNDNFEPYDYSQSDLTAFTEKRTCSKREKRNFKGKQNSSRRPGRHAKQAMFNSKSNARGNTARSWPNK